MMSIAKPTRSDFFVTHKLTFVDIRSFPKLISPNILPRVVWRAKKIPMLVIIVREKNTIWLNPNRAGIGHLKQKNFTVSLIMNLD